MKRPARYAATAFALVCAFALGLFVGHRGLLRAAPPVFRGFEIRGGRQGLLNPLLECEVDAPGADVEVQPFGRDLDEFVTSLERQAQVEQMAVVSRANALRWRDIRTRSRRSVKYAG